MPEVSASITAENTFTPPLGIDHPTRMVDVSISGTFDATVSVQRSFDGVTWHTMEEYTAPSQRIGNEAKNGTLWRAGVLTGDFNSGTVELLLGY